MDLYQLQRREKSRTELVKATYRKYPNRPSTSFDWKRASGKLNILHRLRRALSRHVRTFKMGIQAMTNKMNTVKMPRTQKWEKEKNKIVFTHHFMRYQKEFRKQMATFIIGAFSFVAALVWNDAIKETLKIIEFNNNFILYKYVTAGIVSVVCVIAIIFLSESNKI